MQVPGALAKRVVRADEPSSAGHGVSPVSVAPPPGPRNVTAWEPPPMFAVTVRVVALPQAITPAQHTAIRAGSLKSIRISGPYQPVLAAPRARPCHAITSA